MKARIDKINPDEDKVGIEITYFEEERQPTPEISAVTIILWYDREQLQGKDISEIERTALKDAPVLLAEITNGKLPADVA